MTAAGADLLPGAGPWCRRDVAVMGGLGSSGAAAVGAAWLGAADALHLDDQVAWVNLGVAGVVLLGVGNVLWLLAGRRRIGEVRRRLLPGAAAVVVEAPARATVRGPLVASRVMTRYHGVACPLVAGKNVRAATLATHLRRGRRPCGVCQPDA